MNISSSDVFLVWLSVVILAAVCMFLWAVTL